jgi:glucokinase
MNSKELCTCGKPGCLEVSSAWPALRKQILDAVLRGTHTCLKAESGNIEDFTYRDVRAALDQGDRMCTFYTKEAAHRIGLALANVVNLLNPEMIVLHGYLLLLGKTFIEEMERTIRDNALPVCADFSTAISNSFENPMLLGAVAGIFSSYLHADDYRWVYQLNADSHN